MRIGTGIDDYAVCAVALAHYHGKARGIFAVNLDKRGVYSVFLVILVQLLSVKVAAELSRENALGAEPCERYRGISSLAARNVGNADVVRNRLAALG